MGGKTYPARTHRSAFLGKRGLRGGALVTARSGLSHQPIPIRLARQFVGQEHRHNPEIHAARWAMAAYLGAHIVGVVMVGNVVPRLLRHPRRAEVVRLATDGTANACSYLYGVAARIARAMGIWSLKTYTLISESGASLRAVGAKLEHQVAAQSWDRPKRRRDDKHTIAPRQRWELLHETAHLCAAQAAS